MKQAYPGPIASWLKGMGTIGWSNCGIWNLFVTPRPSPWSSSLPKSWSSRRPTCARCLMSESSSASSQKPRFKNGKAKFPAKTFESDPLIWSTEIDLSTTAWHRSTSEWSSPGTNTAKLILPQPSLWLHFDALFEGLREFKTVHICICYKGTIRITSNW